MRWKGLIADTMTGDVSHTKVWSNVAYCAATFAFCWGAWHATLTPDIWLIYMGVVGAHSATSKLIGMKYGVPATGAGAAA